MDQIDTELLETQKHKPLDSFHYNEDVFFIWTYCKEKLSSFLEDLNMFHPKIRFTHETNKYTIHFLDLKVTLPDCKISTGCLLNLQTGINFFTIYCLI